MAVVLTIPCGGEEHRLEIRRDGTIHPLDHDANTLAAFTAFGADPPECWKQIALWHDAQPGAVDDHKGLQLESALLFLSEFISDKDIRLIATDWAAHGLPYYENIKTRSKLATLPRRFLKAIRAALRSQHDAKALKKRLAPIWAEVGTSRTYLNNHRLRMPYPSSAYLEARIAEEVLDAAAACYYLVIALKGWYIRPPRFQETTEATVSVAMHSRKVFGAIHPEDARGAEDDEQIWQLWHAAKVVHALQQGKRWPRVS
jgi:hypothetical protein